MVVPLREQHGRARRHLVVMPQMCRNGPAADRDLMPRVLLRARVMADRHLVLVLRSTRPTVRECRAAAHPERHAPPGPRVKGGETPGAARAADPTRQRRRRACGLHYETIFSSGDLPELPSSVLPFLRTTSVLGKPKPHCPREMKAQSKGFVNSLWAAAAPPRRCGPRGLAPADEVRQVLELEALLPRRELHDVADRDDADHGPFVDHRHVP